MQKAILVMDMPDRCCNCPMNFWNNCGILQYNWQPHRIENPSTERLPNCPLRPVPEKIDMYKSITQDPDYSAEYGFGYNDCIDEILEE